MAYRLTVASDNGTVSLIEVSPSAKISTLSHQIHAEHSIPPNQQDLRFNGTPLNPSATVASSGLSDGDLIMVSRKQQSAAPQASAGSDSQMLNSLRGNRQFMDQLRRVNPDMARTLQNGGRDATRMLQDMIRSQQGFDMGGAMGQRSFVDPMSADAQKEIEERIRMENVMKNMEAAIEHNPESFGSVVMLFVDCKVNSVSGIKAFVDSGAQATIISKQCAERCNILRLLDTRFSGVAHGVGSARIHGRIHLALLTLGSEVFEVSFTVMDAVGGSYDMLLGLDMLRKHQACIDLRDNCLRIGQSEVPFLAEKDIPREMLSVGRELQRQAHELSLNSDGSIASSGSRRGPSASPRAAATTGDRAGATSGRARSSDKVGQLVELGFSRREAEEALRACNGDADQAAAMLTANKYGF